MNKSLYKSIIIKALIVIAALYVITFVVSRNNLIALGFVIGGLTRLVGFLSIIISTEYLADSTKPGILAAGMYIVRFIFYGVIVSWSIVKGVNVLSLLVGFIILNFIIYGTQWRMRRAT